MTDPFQLLRTSVTHALRANFKLSSDLKTVTLKHYTHPHTHKKRREKTKGEIVMCHVRVLNMWVLIAVNIRGIQIKSKLLSA